MLKRIVAPLAVWAVTKVLETPRVKGAVARVDRKLYKKRRKVARNAMKNRVWLAAGKAVAGECQDIHPSVSAQNDRIGHSGVHHVEHSADRIESAEEHGHEFAPLQLLAQTRVQRAHHIRRAAARRQKRDHRLAA